MRYTYIAYSSDMTRIYVHEDVCKVEGDSVKLYYYSTKKTARAYIPDVVQFTSDFVSKEGIVLSFLFDWPTCHMFLPETHALFNSYLVIYAHGDATIGEEEHIIYDMLHNVYKGVMQEYRAHHSYDERGPHSS